MRIAAAFDLVVTAPLAVPGTATWFVAAMAWVDPFLGGSGAPPALDPLGWLFVHLAGVLGVAWAWARLRWPVRELATADAVARVWVALLLFRAIVAGAPRVLVWFALTELLGAVAQAAVRRDLVRAR